MPKQPLKKNSTTKMGSLSAFKSKLGLTSDNLNTSNANKPLSWIIMPPAFCEATKLPGICCGYVNNTLGHSNVGKSTLVNHAITSHQRAGGIPVIIDTENNFSFEYAINMGFKADPIYGEVDVEKTDPETGEISYVKEKQIINYEGNFLYFNNNILKELYGNIDYSKGTKTKEKRSQAVIEDVAYCINELLDAQENGEIQADLLFVWDSVGSISCFKEYSSGKIGNSMWNAQSIAQSFQNIVNERIPGSRKISSPYTNTLLCVNKIWLDSMSNPVGPPSVKRKGGNSLYYATRCEFFLGGKLTSATKRLTATSKGYTYTYGIETKIKIEKNQLDNPYNLTSEGKMIATSFGFIKPDEIEEFKKNNMKQILEELNKMAEGKDVISEEDITFETQEEDGSED